MGQAVELPDPLEQPKATAAAASSADDLLAQLASDEIDRLLVEAETDTGPTLTAATPVEDELAAIAPEVVATPIVENEVTAEAPAVAPAEAAIEPVAAVGESAAEVTPKETIDPAALAESAAHADSASPAERSELLAVHTPVVEKTPWWIKPLDWLTPNVSDHAREAIGKVAIATLVMAATIILYTLSTRKH